MSQQYEVQHEGQTYRLTVAGRVLLSIEHREPDHYVPFDLRSRTGQKIAQQERLTL